MLDIPTYMGVNAPREHQRVITQLVASLYWLYTEGNINLEPLSETMLDEGKTSPTPDVILANNVLDRDVVMIEVTTTRGEPDDFEKVKQLVNRYKLEEGFTYNYQKKEWRKANHLGEVVENPSFCESIGYDLNSFLR